MKLTQIFLSGYLCQVEALLSTRSSLFDYAQATETYRCAGQIKSYDDEFKKWVTSDSSKSGSPPNDMVGYMSINDMIRNKPLPKIAEGSYTNEGYCAVTFIRTGADNIRGMFAGGHLIDSPNEDEKTWDDNTLNSLMEEIDYPKNTGFFRSNLGTDDADQAYQTCYCQGDNCDRDLMEKIKRKNFVRHNDSEDLTPASREQAIKQYLLRPNTVGLGLPNRKINQNCPGKDCSKLDTSNMVGFCPGPFIRPLDFSDTLRMCLEILAYVLLGILFVVELGHITSWYHFNLEQNHVTDIDRKIKHKSVAKNYSPKLVTVNHNKLFYKASAIYKSVLFVYLKKQFERFINWYHVERNSEGVKLKQKYDSVLEWGWAFQIRFTRRNDYLIEHLGLQPKDDESYMVNEKSKKSNKKKSLKKSSSGGSAKKSNSSSSKNSNSGDIAQTKPKSLKVYKREHDQSFHVNKK